MREDEWIVKEIEPGDTDFVPSATEQFYRQVRTGREPEYTVAMALNAVAAIDAGLRSSHRGEVVQVEEVLDRLPRGT